MYAYPWNMKKLPCFLGFLLLWSLTTSYSQSKWNPEDAIIYSEDGSVYIGQIVFEDTWQIDLLIQTGDTIHLGKKDIDKTWRSKENITMLRKGRFHFKNTLFVGLDIAFGLDQDDVVGSALVNLIVGYHFNDRVSAGLGMGSHINTAVIGDLFYEHNFTPFFGHGRYYLSQKTNARFFVFSNLGYGFPIQSEWLDEFDGGLFFNGGIGIHFASKKNVRYTMKVYQYMQGTSGVDVTADLFNRPITTKYNYWYNRTVLAFGMSFR